MDQRLKILRMRLGENAVMQVQIFSGTKENVQKDVNEFCKDADEKDLEVFDVVFAVNDRSFNVMVIYIIRERQE